MESLPPNQAPGQDLISDEVVIEVLLYHPRWLLAFYNHCLSISCFPRTWKRAIVICFLKPEKKASDPASYHPICLLPALGKVLDKLCATRLAFFLETNELLEARQYGFRKNLSTVDALRSVLEFIAESKKRREFTCLFTLDIKSAFNSVLWAYVLRILQELGVEPSLLSLIDVYL